MFIGSKGYTIPKEVLTPIQHHELCRKLTFKIRQDYGDDKVFKAWRESPHKMYIPRFYGLSTYGEVPSTLKEGKSIQVEFTGSIRENQIGAVDAFLKAKCGLLELPCGFGKTIVALHLIHRIGKKTLVIVHKEFLLEQWIERIREFLPTATIGRLQGDTMDVNKDIVIGMLQSISMKTYPKEVFDGFGFTIIDETHHIAAEVFSNSLFHIVTPYMLGLSATMERKDGLTKVFKMFLGEVVFSAKREQTTVYIHKSTYSNENEEYNKVILNFRGETNYTSMIKKISEYNDRKDYILTIITKLLAMPTTEQIMILAHTKALLAYLYQAIEHRNLGTVGYYVGGMKQAALKETETKKIVLATYAMAEEALDIKTLTTLILATPKTDVTQAVGRILRVKHERPTVIDIVDTHPTFQNQWNKRRSFYNKQGYTILKELT
jgi:superfamily II DNA or RNA helicase